MSETSPYAVVLCTSASVYRPHRASSSLRTPRTRALPGNHVLMPLDDARARIQASMGSLQPELVPGAGIPLTDIDPGEIVEEVKAASERELANALEVLRATGSTTVGELVTGDPIAALAAKVAEVDGREAIILTEDHFVAELLRLDWTSQARRHLDVPVLHLMEQETFNEQAGGGEGVTGL